MTDKGLYWEFKCDERLSRVVPYNPEVRHTRSKNKVYYSTFFTFVGHHIDVASIGKRKEVLERMASPVGRVVGARERAEPWVGWVRRACAVGEEGMEEVEKVKKEVKKERLVDNHFEYDKKLRYDNKLMYVSCMLYGCDTECER